MAKKAGEKAEKARLRASEWYAENPEVVKARSKKWREDNPARRRESDRAAHLKRTYDLSVEEWDKIYDYQQGLCAVCGKLLRKRRGDENGVRASTDHCHKTGLIRGLLCSYPCNGVLQMLRDQAPLFVACARYLENPPASLALGASKFTAPGRIGTKKRAKFLKFMRERPKPDAR